MRSIMFLNSKGGCGKTTLATNLAAYYASKNYSVVLADFDPQGSSLDWLEARPADAPPIRGLAAWRDGLRFMPRSADYIIMDVPARCHGPELTALVRRAQTHVIPVLPAPTDIRAAAHFIHELLLVGRVQRDETRVAVIANRVRENTLMQTAVERTLNAASIPYATLNTKIYHNLERFLTRLHIPFVTALRENPHYLLADAKGLGIFELKHAPVAHDFEQWVPLIKWLDSRRALPQAA